MRLLIVEDDPQLREILATGLREQGYEAVTAASFREGRERAALGTYGLLILDVLLPGAARMNVRQANSGLPPGGGRRGAFRAKR